MRLDNSSQQRLSRIVAAYPLCAWYGKRNATVSALIHSSKDIRPGDAFVAFPGWHRDGHDFIPDAIRRGARTILCQRRPEYLHPECTYIVVSNVRKAFSVFSDIFWRKPSRSLYVIGVTGTNGKSTIVHMIHQLLEQHGYSAGFVSTVAKKSTDTVALNKVHLSTPEAFDVHRELAIMRDSKKQYAVIESTSHALSKQTRRLESVHFKAGLICNISHEHIDFHGNFAQYKSDKAELLRALPKHAPAVLNADDPNADYCAGQTNATPFYFSLSSPDADLRTNIITEGITNSRTQLVYKNQSCECILPFAATLQADNVLAALLMTSRVLNCSPLDLAPITQSLALPKGRMQQLTASPRIIIDYAHTPAAFSRLLPFVRTYTNQKLIVVFGSAGERDVGKRALQGKIAGQFADIVILCDEDPRSEGSDAIINDIAQGLQSFEHDGGILYRIQDRHQAIEKAISLAHKDDTVLLLGKGHEQSILYNNSSKPWDEEQVVREIIGSCNA